MIGKRYLGDAVYANYDGYHVILTTEDGISTTNEILLEPSVLAALDHYVEAIKEERARREEEDYD